MTLFKSIRDRLAKATPGPWTTFHPRLRYCANDVVAETEEGREPFVLANMNRHFPNWKLDAEFIAHSPTDIATLLEAVDVMREALIHAKAFRYSPTFDMRIEHALAKVQALSDKAEG